MDPLQPKRRPRGKGAIAPQHYPARPTDGVSEFTQLALWMAASLAGMVTALILARRPFFESLMRSVGRPAGAGAGQRGGSRKGGSPRRAARRPGPEESLPMLADAIVGNTKAAVASVFGPPRSAAVRGVVKAGGKSPAFWQASTWYYPLPRNDALAMAIEFDHDAARRVEFFRAPGL
jgi:hypothetical protein